MIDINNIRILSNYVLVLPDKNFETYQFSAKETGIYSPLVFKDEQGHEHSAKQQHLSISGVVYGVPEKLLFNAERIWEIQDRTDLRRDAWVRNREWQSEIDELRTKSVRFNVPIELKKGDRVYFEYTAHRDADTQGLWVQTELGLMMMIKYDSLILAKRGEDTVMLNGYVLVENEKAEVEQIEHGVLGTHTDSGLVLLQGTRVDKKTRTNAVAKVVHSGAPVGSYLDFRGIKEKQAATGDTILYDPRYARELEYGLHQVFSGRKLRMIQRKDIYGIFN